MGSPVPPPSSSSAMAQRPSNPQAQHLAAGRQVAPPQQHMQQRPQPGQQPQPQGQSLPGQGPMPAQQGPEASGNGSQPLPSPRNLQRVQLQQYMSTLPPEKRQEVWQQIQARNAAARSNQAAQQAAAAAGVLSPQGMQQHVNALGQNTNALGQSPPGGQNPLNPGNGAPNPAGVPMGRGAGPQVGVGRGRVAPGRSRGMQLPANANPQSPAQLAAAAAIAQVAAANVQTQQQAVHQQLGGPNLHSISANLQRNPTPLGQLPQDESSPALRGNPSNVSSMQGGAQEGILSPPSGVPTPAAYPYNLQQAQMSAMLQKPGGISPTTALGGQGVAPPIGMGQAPAIVDSGRNPMQSGQTSQPLDK
jgi:hypothetical protein